MDLFRPFITNKQNKTAHDSNDLSNVPNIIFEASTKRESFAIKRGVT
jgi:hypothetical protein